MLLDKITLYESLKLFQLSAFEVECLQAKTLQKPCSIGWKYITSTMLLLNILEGTTLSITCYIKQG